MSMIADNKLVEYNGDKIINYGAVKLGIGGEKVKMITLDSLKLKQLDKIIILIIQLLFYNRYYFISISALQSGSE